MITTRDNQLFTESIMVDYPLDKAIEWIKRNFNPENVFDKAQLETWANENGYIKE